MQMRLKKHRQYAASGNRDCVDSGFYRNHELYEHLYGKCAEPDDGAFGYGEYRDDPEAASWNAGQEGVLYAGGAWLVTLTVGMGVTYLLYESMNYRGIAFSVPLLPLLFAVGISFLVCTMVPVLTWIILEKNGTVVERIKGVE